MKTVFFDVDTQIDFMFPAGALYVPGAETIVDIVSRLNRHAWAAGLPLVSTADAHLENDDEFRQWPAHCVVGTVGQQKPAATLLDKRMIVPPTDWAERIDGIPQLILEKRHNDCFTNPNLEALMLAFQADRYVVYGVVTEICVQKAAFGLLQTGKPVDLVTDAVQCLNPQAQEEMFAEFVRLGGRLTTSTSL